MGYKPKFKVGEVLSNDEIRKAYKVGMQGGMRKSNTYNCLVIISDHTKGLYDDKWHDDELHYTGMGTQGDQVLQGNQNGTLYNSNTNGVEIHLFEVLVPREYIYVGVVKLCGKPYQEQQPDVNGKMRKVWMFPVKPVAGTPIVPAEKFNSLQVKKQKQAEAMSMEDLKRLAEAKSKSNPGTRKVTSTEIVRDPHVSEYVKRAAKGICALCGQPAPFKDKKGQPYLETHHIIWLSKGGADSIDNTAALCPNCHTKMHIVNDAADVKILLTYAKNNAQ